MKTKLLCLLMAIGLCALPQKESRSVDYVYYSQLPTSKIDVKVYNNKHKNISIKYKKTNETSSQIDIVPSGNYYNRYNSNTRFNADLKEGMCEAYYEYPTINCYIVNNTNHNLNISNLQIDVEYSKIDRTPYIYIISTQSDPNCMSFFNFSCYNWGNMTFEYSILGKGEQFDYKYKKKRIIPYFDYKYQIDFRSELRALGYDIDRIEKLCKLDNDFKWKYYGAFTETDVNKYGYLFYPFDFFPSTLIMPNYESNGTYIANDNYYCPLAPIYGRLTFSNSDKMVEFVGYICLNSIDGLGAVTFLDDSFNVKLRTSALDYIVHYPYKTVIPPGGSECIRMTIACEKSSNHRFRIKVKNYEGYNVISKYINLHMLNHTGIHIVTDEELNKDL